MGPGARRSNEVTIRPDPLGVDRRALGQLRSQRYHRSRTWRPVATNRSPVVARAADRLRARLCTRGSCGFIPYVELCLVARALQIFGYGTIAECAGKDWKAREGRLKKVPRTHATHTPIHVMHMSTRTMPTTCTYLAVPHTRLPVPCRYPCCTRGKACTARAMMALWPCQTF